MLRASSLPAVLITCVLTLTAAPFTAGARADSSETAAQAQTPEQVAEAYFKALQEEGLTSSARFFHPEELEKFKTMLAPIFAVEAEAGGRDLLDAIFGPEATLETVETAKGEDFMRGIMGALEAQLGGQSFNFRQMKILGSVPEEDIRHVLARFTVDVGEISNTKVEVVSMRPQGNTWALLLTGQLEGLAKALQAEYASQPEAAPQPESQDTGTTSSGQG